MERHFILAWGNDASIVSFMDTLLHSRYLLSFGSCALRNVNLHYVENVIYEIMTWESRLILHKKFGQRTTTPHKSLLVAHSMEIAFFFFFAFSFSSRPCKSQIKHSSSFDHTLYCICYWSDTFGHDVNLMSTNSSLISNQLNVSIQTWHKSVD